MHTTLYYLRDSITFYVSMHVHDIEGICIDFVCETGLTDSSPTGAMEGFGGRIYWEGKGG